MSEQTKQKAPKKIWLALLLTVLFGPLGLFYVSWLSAIVLLGVYLGMDSLLPWHTFVKVTFWWVLPTLSALGFSSPKKKQEESETAPAATPAAPAAPGAAAAAPKNSETPHSLNQVDPEGLKTRISKLKEQLFAKIEDLAQEALIKATDPEQFAATLSWESITPESLTAKSPSKPYLAKTIRIGETYHEALGESFGEESGFHPVFLPLARRTMLGLLYPPEAPEGIAENLIQATVLRVLCSLPPGAAQIHLIDLQTMGRAFPALSTLDPSLVPIAPSTPTERTQFFQKMEERVADLSRRCLNKYEWLCDFNKENPDEAEVYHFICLSGMTNLLEAESLSAIDRLCRKECGARCGIYFFITSAIGDSNACLPDHDLCNATKAQFVGPSGAVYLRDAEFDNAHDVPYVPIVGADGSFQGWVSPSPTGEMSDFMLCEEELPDHWQDIVGWLNATAKGKPKAKKVSVVVTDANAWKSNAAHGVSIPIGKAGREDVLFNLGNDAVVHHALIGGATGTGKTVLLHNIILNAAELYSPEDLQMILMDFKEGTEFACYEGLPHMRVLSVASELHFGHNVFEWLVAERMRRAGLFKKVGAANLGDYISKSGLKMPRILVIMDEFQRILGDPNIGSQVSLLLDDIVRTGRSFGINLVLSTQSLANVQLESSTLTSVGLRVCMRLSEQEATRFLNYDNTLPTSFNRAGQAVYNDSEGRKEGNKEFQVAFVEVSEIPSRCESLRQREMERFGKRIVDNARVFHGETPVDPSKGLPPPSGDHLAAFIGEPLKLDASPLSISFEQKDGAHVIAIAQSFDILNTLSNNLAVQFLQRDVVPDISIVDSFPLAKDRWTWATERGSQLLVTPQATHDALDSLVAELETRKLQETEEVFSSKVLFLIEPQGAKAFPVSTTGEASPAAIKVQALLDQGSRHGIHIILLSSRLTRTDKVLGNFGPLNLQPFSLRIAFKSEEASNLVYDSSTKTLGSYSGVMSDETTGEITPFQIYDTITT